MAICRLCGAEKSPDELVISLLQSIQTITFQEFVEYYCRFTLDPDLELPQQVCKSCKIIVENFIQFSYAVEQQQLVIVKNKKERAENEKTLQCANEPETKKAKLDQLEDLQKEENAEGECHKIVASDVIDLRQGTDMKNERARRKSKQEMNENVSLI